MVSMIKLGTSFGAATLLMGCASTTLPVNHIDAGARQHIKTVDSVVVTRQDQIGADVAESSGLANVLGMVQGTPIPILVDAGLTGIRVVRANNAAKPVREKLEDFDYPKVFRDRLEGSISASNLEGLKEFELVQSEWPGFRLEFIEDSNADAVLFIDMRYAFTSKFDALYVTAHALMMPNTPELRPFQHKPDKDNIVEMDDNIYRNQFVAVLRPQDSDGTRAGNVAYWAGLSDEQLTATLNAAATKLADTLASDLSLDDSTPTGVIDAPTNTDIEIAQEDVDAVKNEDVAPATRIEAPSSEIIKDEVKDTEQPEAGSTS